MLDQQPKNSLDIPGKRKDIKLYYKASARKVMRHWVRDRQITQEQKRDKSMQILNLIYQKHQLK